MDGVAVVSACPHARILQHDRIRHTDCARRRHVRRRHNVMGWFVIFSL